jgi:hypothetical protein
MHPGDVVRGYLAAATVRLLGFAQNRDWADAIEAEADRDAASIALAGNPVDVAQAKQAAKAVARAIADTKLKSLEKHSLHGIQDWKDSDERIAATLRVKLAQGKTRVPAGIADTSYATHVVAAAVIAAVLGEATPKVLFESMVGMLKRMHDDNPSWGPLFVGHRGDNLRRVVADRR